MALMGKIWSAIKLISIYLWDKLQRYIRFPVYITNFTTNTRGDLPLVTP